MLPANQFAFKEWAAVCAALAEGRQTVILRKGGIDEGPDGFRVEHNEFWLFPTRFHQNPDELSPEALPLLEQVDRDQPPTGMLRISLYAVVDHIFHLRDERQLPLLAGMTVLHERVVDERFHYRRDGLFVLPVRIYRLPQRLIIPNSPHFTGCRTWVDLPIELPTDSLKPVLSDAEHAERLAEIRRRLNPIATT